MAIRVEAYACEHCGKVFSGEDALGCAETHEKKLGSPNYFYDIGFTFLSELFWQRGVHELEIVDRAADEESHVPFYLLKKVEDGKLFDPWNSQRHIFVEIEQQTHYEIYVK